jgi:hypothetical protein
MTSTDIADLLARYRVNRERQKALKDEMVRVAVEVLGLPQEEAVKKYERLEFILDGYLIGQGMQQEWRKTE